MSWKINPTTIKTIAIWDIKNEIIIFLFSFFVNFRICKVGLSLDIVDGSPKKNNIITPIMSKDKPIFVQFINSIILHLFNISQLRSSCKGFFLILAGRYRQLTKEGKIAQRAVFFCVSETRLKQNNLNARIRVLLRSQLRLLPITDTYKVSVAFRNCTLCGVLKRFF